MSDVTFDRSATNRRLCAVPLTGFWEIRPPNVGEDLFKKSDPALISQEKMRNLGSLRDSISLSSGTFVASTFPATSHLGLVIRSVILVISARLVYDKDRRKTQSHYEEIVSS